MAGTVFTEWLNANSSRNYPIVENLSRKDISGKLTLPNQLILAAQVNVSRSEVEGSFFIKEVGSFGGSCYVTIGYAHTVGTTLVMDDIAKVNIDYSTHVTYQYYPFVGQQENAHIVGFVCIGEVEELKKEGLGKLEFMPDSTALEPNCLFVSIPALKAVNIYSGSSLIHIATDVLRLRAGENIRLTYEDDDKTIRIDAISGLNLDTKDSCNNNPFSIPGCIKTINGIGPDDTGNFKILGSECIGIIDNHESNGVSIQDLCSQSCCGCDELDVLVAGLDQLRAQEESLKLLIESVQAQQSSLISSLASNIV